MDSMNKLRLVFGDNMLGVHGQGFRYVFSYFGGLDSLVIQERNGCIVLPDRPFGEL